MANEHYNMYLKLIKAFGDALERHMKVEVWGDSPEFWAACDAQQHAFDLAEDYGWDWDDDMDFSNWCLKATAPDINAEGLRIALDKCSPFYRNGDRRPVAS